MIPTYRTLGDSQVTRRKLIAILIFAIIVVSLPLADIYFTSYSHRQTLRKPITDYSTFVDSLEAAGISVKPVGGELEEGFFSVNAKTIIINNEYLFVTFEYADNASAQADASLVSADGRSIGTAKPSFGFTPHFFKSGRLIVLYVGDNLNAMKILVSLLGPQFAGG